VVSLSDCNYYVCNPSHSELPSRSHGRVCGWQKNDLGSVLQKNCGFQFGFGLTKLTAVSVRFFAPCDFELHSTVDNIFHLRLYSMMLEMTFFRAELVQLTVSRSDSELEVQRYGMKKNTLTVDPIMLQDEL